MKKKEIKKEGNHMKLMAWKYKRMKKGELKKKEKSSLTKKNKKSKGRKENHIRKK